MDLYELSGRFALLIISILLLYFFSNRRKTERINPLFMIVGLCTFSLCYLFTKIQIGIGIGFGLFAIFSILRFRTKAFTVNVIVFLFAIITLSILDMLFPLDKFRDLIFFQSAVLLFFFLITLKSVRYTNKIEMTLSTEDLSSVDHKKIHKEISSKIGIGKFEFKVVGFNAVSKELKVEIFH